MQSVVGGSTSVTWELVRNVLLPRGWGWFCLETISMKKFLVSGTSRVAFRSVSRRPESLILAGSVSPGVQFTSLWLFFLLVPSLTWDGLRTWAL